MLKKTIKVLYFKIVPSDDLVNIEQYMKGSSLLRFCWMNSLEASGRKDTKRLSKDDAHNWKMTSWFQADE